MVFCSSSAVVHSQHHCIVRVIKLLNKFHLSRLLSLWTQKSARMKICSDTRRANEKRFSALFFLQQSQNFSIVRWKILFFLRELEWNFSTEWKLVNCHSEKGFRFMSRNFRFKSVARMNCAVRVNCHSLLIVSRSQPKNTHTFRRIDCDATHHMWCHCSRKKRTREWSKKRLKRGEKVSKPFRFPHDMFILRSISIDIGVE
jgi:hypothetical protein